MILNSILDWSMKKINSQSRWLLNLFGINFIYYCLTYLLFIIVWLLTVEFYSFFDRYWYKFWTRLYDIWGAYIKWWNFNPWNYIYFESLKAPNLRKFVFEAFYLYELFNNRWKLIIIYQILSYFKDLVMIYHILLTIGLQISLLWSS